MDTSTLHTNERILIFFFQTLCNNWGSKLKFKNLGEKSKLPHKLFWTKMNTIIEQTIFEKKICEFYYIGLHKRP